MTDLGYRDLVGSVDALTATARYRRDRPIPRGSETEMGRHHRPQQLADTNDPDFRDRSPPGGLALGDGTQLTARSSPPAHHSSPLSTPARCARQPAVHLAWAQPATTSLERFGR